MKYNEHQPRGAHRGQAPRLGPPGGHGYHQGVARDRVVAVGRVVPGDDPRAHAGGHGGQERPAGRASRRTSSSESSSPPEPDLRSTATSRSRRRKRPRASVTRTASSPSDGAYSDADLSYRRLRQLLDGRLHARHLQLIPQLNKTKAPVRRGLRRPLRAPVGVHCAARLTVEGERGRYGAHRRSQPVAGVAGRAALRGCRRNACVAGRTGCPRHGPLRRRHAPRGDIGARGLRPRSPSGRRRSTAPPRSTAATSTRRPCGASSPGPRRCSWPDRTPRRRHRGHRARRCASAGGRGDAARGAGRRARSSPHCRSSRPTPPPIADPRCGAGLLAASRTAGSDLHDALPRGRSRSRPSATALARERRDGVASPEVRSPARRLRVELSACLDTARHLAYSTTDLVGLGAFGARPTRCARRCCGVAGRREVRVLRVDEDVVAPEERPTVGDRIRRVRPRLLAARAAVRGVAVKPWCVASSLSMSSAGPRDTRRSRCAAPSCPRPGRPRCRRGCRRPARPRGRRRDR